MLSHAYVFEILQLLGALIGMAVNSYALVQAQRDAEALAMSGTNGVRKVVADGNIQQELIRLVVQMLLVAIGVVSIVLPPPNPEVPEVFMRTGQITRVILLLITFLLAFKSLLDVRDRRTMMRLWMQRRRQGESEHDHREGEAGHDRQGEVGRDRRSE